MTYHAGNFFLTESQMKDNAKYIFTFLSPRGWTAQAIAAMLGNMETESTINPAIWQNLDENNTSLCFGLVQWTPSTKYTSWCAENGLDPAAMDSALMRIEYELENGLQWIHTNEYPFTFADFKVMTLDVGYMADAFLKCYERPADQDQPARATQALKWYEYLTNLKPEQQHRKQTKIPLWLLVSAARR